MSAEMVATAHTFEQRLNHLVLTLGVYKSMTVEISALYINIRYIFFNTRLNT